MAAPDPQAWSHRSKALAEVLARVALGDRSAFAELYRTTSAHLLGVILRIQPQRAQAEEVLQEVYLNVWRAAQRYEAGQSQPYTWLASIARNRAIDSLRRAQARPQKAETPVPDDEQDPDVTDTHPDPGPGPADLWQQAVAARLLRQCLDTLSDEQQQSLAPAYYQGLTHSEVAEQMSAPLGSVKSWVRRGLQALKACLDRSGGEGAL
ncbi:sigma-70 family RNA polymerase sigma factor [Schlegelella sp. S2-27]|uniref:RNA polymerase sigma factor n=1 Tax=Caldimonas mangrovi TaxID=2944811 RepID=A0ABT0YVM5_9BURK|nr:sigma-70 family RNA polymerase sigma factor [Caldimonas mangrovi]MCM5682352.1 sigma-70 family RNA polymerase sigma factor [Caldimonas mangrovi]